MNSWMKVISQWHFEPSIVIGCLALLVGYFTATRFKITWKALIFVVGVLIWFVALESPIDEIGEDYLFSVHMLQHMMLEFIGPVFLVAGLTPSVVRGMLKFKPIEVIERILGNPIVALATATVVMLFWHIPRFYDIALENGPIHIFEHLTFMASGIMLWWPVFKPIPEGRFGPLLGAGYLSLACFLASIPGMIFTISDAPFYTAYAHPKDELGILSLIREQWGIGQLEDQKLGGAVMWVLCTMNFLWAVMALIVEWLTEREGTDVGTARS